MVNIFISVELFIENMFVLLLVLSIICHSNGQVYNSERSVKLGEEPWHVSLDVYYGNNNKPVTSTICSGIILSDRSASNIR